VGREEDKMILDDEVFAVLMAIVIVSCAIAIAMTITRKTEPFAAIGILNEEGKMNYPRTVISGKPLKLNVFIDNHEGRASAFIVFVKLGSRGNIPNNTNPLNSEPIWNYTIVLNDRSNITIPVELNLSGEGNDVAIVFELWEFNSSKWVYTGRWCHLYVNLTRGAPNG
jgi:uncharacterized membrane protein